MAKRWKMGRKASKRNFARNSRVHPKNNLASGSSYVMRGGIRL